MEIKSLNIGGLTTKNNVFFAPLAGFSTKQMRSICYQLGAGLCFTEMVSCKGLKFGSSGTCELLELAENEYLPAVQVFGNDKDIMLEACQSESLKPFKIVDINMGCPVPKVFNNGEGSALMKNVDLAQKIVENLVKSDKVITVKMRAGIKKGEKTALILAKAVEDAGAKMVTVHGRCREDYYSGEVDFDLIAKIKQNAKIPIIANGGVFTKEDADILMERTGADGVMVARGALFNPFLISELLNLSPKMTKKELIINHIERVVLDESEERAIIKMRKQLAYYLNGVRGAKQIKPALFTAVTKSEVLKLINTIM